MLCASIDAEPRLSSISKKEKPEGGWRLGGGPQERGREGSLPAPPALAPCHGRGTAAPEPELRSLPWTTKRNARSIPADSKGSCYSRSERELFATAWERFLTVSTRFVLTNKFLFSFIKMFKYEKVQNLKIV
jgi:hypothetical protein